jgi:hypothetical protein
MPRRALGPTGSSARRPTPQTLPLAPQDVAAAIQPAQDTYLQIRELNANRASRKAINATFTALARRLGLDPWLPFDTTVSPSAVGGSGAARRDLGPVWGQ